MLSIHNNFSAGTQNVTGAYVIMDDILYSCIRVIYVLCPCAVGFALRNVRDIF